MEGRGRGVGGAVDLFFNIQGVGSTYFSLLEKTFLLAVATFPTFKGRDQFFSNFYLPLGERGRLFLKHLRKGGDFSPLLLKPHNI